MHTTNGVQLYGLMEPNVHPQGYPSENREADNAVQVFRMSDSNVHSQVLPFTSEEYWITWRVYDIFFLIQVYGIFCRLALAVGFNTDSGGFSVANELLMVVRKQGQNFVTFVVGRWANYEIQT